LTLGLDATSAANTNFVVADISGPPTYNFEKPSIYAREVRVYRISTKILREHDGKPIFAVFTYESYLNGIVDEVYYYIVCNDKAIENPYMYYDMLNGHLFIDRNLSGLPSVISDNLQEHVRAFLNQPPECL